MMPGGRHAVCGEMFTGGVLMFDDSYLNKNEFTAVVSFAGNFHVLDATGMVWILTSAHMETHARILTSHMTSLISIVLERFYRENYQKICF